MSAKAETTSIHEYLKQQTDVFMTDWKEPCFLNLRIYHHQRILQIQI